MEQEVINIDELKSIIEARDSAALLAYIARWEITDVVVALRELNEDDQQFLFGIISYEIASNAFKFLEFNEQQLLLKSISSQYVAQLLNELPPDDRTAYLEELSSVAVQELLKLLSVEERIVTLKLLGYPEGSVGRLMTPDYVAVKPHWTADTVLTYIRLYGKNSETINVVYVVDENGLLIDDIRIREFLFCDHDKTVQELTDGKFIKLLATDDEESAIKVFRDNNRVALPVTDAAGVLLGIVTIDDVLRLAEEEGTEDIQMIGGTEALEEPYLDTPFFTLIRKRAGWLTVLFFGELLTATAMGFFEGEISKAVVLALFIPLIISSGGNSGSQAATLIIRAMSIGEVALSDWWRVMRREIFSGICLGAILGLFGFIRIEAWAAMYPDVYGPYHVAVAFTVALSLFGVVLWGTLTGSMLPLILKRFGADPAVSSAPFIATLVDVTGLIIYFGLALALFKGTLL